MILLDYYNFQTSNYKTLNYKKEKNGQNQIAGKERRYARDDKKNLSD